MCNVRTRQAEAACYEAETLLPHAGDLACRGARRRLRSSRSGSRRSATTPATCWAPRLRWLQPKPLQR